MRQFAGKQTTKKVPFMDGELEIRKLSAGAVKRIGETAKKAQEDDDASTLDSLVVILNEAVVLGPKEEPIDADLLDEFPLDALNDLAGAIMDYAGVGAAVGNVEG